MASFGHPDMTHPIKYALFYPNNYNNFENKMNIDRLNNLTFETIKEEKYHALRLLDQF